MRVARAAPHAPLTCSLQSPRVCKTARLTWQRTPRPTASRRSHQSPLGLLCLLVSLHSTSAATMPSSAAPCDCARKKTQTQRQQQHALATPMHPMERRRQIVCAHSIIWLVQATLSAASRPLTWCAVPTSNYGTARERILTLSPFLLAPMSFASTVDASIIVTVQVPQDVQGSFLSRGPACVADV